MTMTLEGKVALISGSGRGIGRAIALKLASAGARIVLNDLDESVANEVWGTIRESGGHAAICVGDVTRPDFGQRFVDTAVDAFGGIDIIVNNAGYTWDSVLQKTQDEQWDAMIGVHLGAPFRILRAAQPVIAAAAKAEMAKGDLPGRRSVVNIASIAGTGGNAGQAGYSSAKAGIVGLTRTVAKEWGRYNVTVNAVAFGIIMTRLTQNDPDNPTIQMQGRDIKVGMGAELVSGMASSIPLGRPGTVEDAAGAVYLLCLPEAGYISGEVLICGGGYRL